MANNRVKSFLNKQRVFLLFIGLMIVFAVSIPGFFASANVINILMSVSIEGIMLIGMTYLIILGEMDLSVGAVMSIGCAVAIMFQPYGSAVAIGMGVAVGVVIGAINSFMVVKLRVPSMPATMGIMVLTNALVYVLTGSTSIWGENESFSLIANSTIFGIPVVAIVFIVLIVLFELILRNTAFGRNVYAVGGNEKSAEYAGIKTKRIRVICFILTGLLSGLAGVLLASRVNVASGLIGGDTALMIITAVLLGGVSLSGGEGSVIKAFFGLLIVGSLDIGMQLLKFPTSIQPMIVGGLLIISLAIDSVSAHKEKFK